MKKSNHTEVPNDFFDEYMHDLSGSEIQVFLIICRKTRGWHKDIDAISTSQIMDLTGLSNRSVISASKSLENKGIIRCDRNDRRATVYEIAYEESSQDEGHPMKKVHTPYEESSQVAYEKSSHTKESTYKETNTKENKSGDGWYSIDDDYKWNGDDTISHKSFLDYFNEIYDKNLIITEGKRENIRARLRTFTGKQIKQSWNNRLKSDYLTGDGKKYLGSWKAAMRSDERVDKWLNKDNSEPEDPYAPKLRTDAVIL